MQGVWETVQVALKLVVIHRVVSCLYLLCDTVGIGCSITFIATAIEFECPVSVEGVAMLKIAHAQL